MSLFGANWHEYPLQDGNGLPSCNGRYTHIITCQGDMYSFTCEYRWAQIEKMYLEHKARRPLTTMFQFLESKFTVRNYKPIIHKVD